MCIRDRRTAIQETVLDAVRSYNEVIEIAGKTTVRTVYALPKFTISPVSYTHLDVYKRQVYALPKFTIPDDQQLVVRNSKLRQGVHRAHGRFPGNLYHLVVAAYHIQYRFLNSRASVSYTHLDVYKRQGFMSLRLRLYTSE